MNWGAKGSLFERQVKAYYESQGYYVIKSGGSLGAFDLIAIREGLVEGIQCKNRRARIANREWNEMVELSERVGIKAILAEKIQGTNTFSLWEPINLIGINGRRDDDNALKLATITIPKRSKCGQSK